MNPYLQQWMKYRVSFLVVFDCILATNESGRVPGCWRGSWDPLCCPWGSLEKLRRLRHAMNLQRLQCLKIGLDIDVHRLVICFHRLSNGIHSTYNTEAD